MMGWYCKKYRTIVVVRIMLYDKGDAKDIVIWSKASDLFENYREASCTMNN